MGGGPPASRPCCVLLLVAPLVFRAPEGPAAREARRPHCVRRRASKPGQAPLPSINFARNSPATCSNIVFASLELQRFRVVSKNDRRKLRARFVWARSAALGCRGLARGRYDPDPPRTSSCLPSITFEAATSWLPKNVARNSPAISSNFEFMSLGLQRFRVVSKNDRGKLRAKFVWAWPAALGCRGLARGRCDPDPPRNAKR